MYFYKSHDLEMNVVIFFDRFSAEEKEKRHPYTFLPYGQGPRMCPGYHFGVFQTKAALVKILKKYVIEKCAQTVVSSYT